MKKNWKFYLGIVLFIYCWLPYIFVFAILPFLNLTTVQALSLSSGLLISSEVAFVISIALLGKEFLQLVKSKIKGIFFTKSGAYKSKPIGKTRFRIGIIIFLISMIVPTLGLEIVFYNNWEEAIGLESFLYILIFFDVLFIISLFILGFEFIDKVRRLFTYSGYRTNNQTDISKQDQ